MHALQEIMAAVAVAGLQVQPRKCELLLPLGADNETYRRALLLFGTTVRIVRPENSSVKIVGAHK